MWAIGGTVQQILNLVTRCMWSASKMLLKQLTYALNIRCGGTQNLAQHAAPLGSEPQFFNQTA